MLPSKSSLPELTGVLHLLGLAGAASLSWRVPEQLMGSTQHHGLRAAMGKQNNCRGAPAVPGSDNSLCHTSCTPCPRAGTCNRVRQERCPSAERYAPSKGRNGATVREEKGHPSCSLTFWVCCSRKQWKCCNVCKASLARLLLSFFSTSGLAFFSHFLKTNLKNQ